MDLIYEGAILYDDWTLNGVGLMSGETIKARERPDRTIVLTVYSAFNNKVYHIYDQFRPIQTLLLIFSVTQNSILKFCHETSDPKIFTEEF